jgi:hypothetical protein
MKKLTDIQLKFLLMIVKLHNEPLVEFTCDWYFTVKRVIDKRYYDDNERPCLNVVVGEYLTWRKKQ